MANEHALIGTTFEWPVGPWVTCLREPDVSGSADQPGIAGPIGGATRSLLQDAHGNDEIICASRPAHQRPAEQVLACRDVVADRVGM